MTPPTIGPLLAAPALSIALGLSASALGRVHEGIEYPAFAHDTGQHSIRSFAYEPVHHCVLELHEYDEPQNGLSCKQTSSSKQNDGGEDGGAIPQSSQ